MSAMYGLTAIFTIPEPRTTEVRRALEKLITTCNWAQDMHLESEPGHDLTYSTHTLVVPETSMSGSGTTNIDSALEALGKLLPDGFRVDYRYDGELGQMFCGPTEEVEEKIRRAWHIEEAQGHLSELGVVIVDDGGFLRLEAA